MEAVCKEGGKAESDSEEGGEDGDEGESAGNKCEPVRADHCDKRCCSSVTLLECCDKRRKWNGTHDEEVPDEIDDERDEASDEDYKSEFCAISVEVGGDDGDDGVESECGDCDGEGIGRCRGIKMGEKCGLQIAGKEGDEKAKSKCFEGDKCAVEVI